MNLEQKVAEFHFATDKEVSSYPRIPQQKEYELRNSLIAEEYHELIEALGHQNVEHIAKEMADLIYVIVGGALEWGIPISEIFEEVHRSNMTKTINLRYENGKIKKGDDYEEPKIREIIWRLES